MSHDTIHYHSHESDREKYDAFISGLIRERDGAREALEERDRMHAEILRVHDAERLRLLAENARLRIALEEIRDLPGEREDESHGIAKRALLKGEK